MTRIGIIGYGFMGRMHLRAYAGEPRANVVAVAETDAKRLVDHAGGNIVGGGGVAGDPNATDRGLPDGVRVHATHEAMLADPEVEAVSICVPTPLHPDLAIAALESGRHVLIEKPLAVTGKEGEPVVAAAAARPDLVCLPAMCVRFWPGWRWLRETIAAGRYGAVRSAVFSRLGAMPGWGGGFYADSSRSGGAILDLHIHDADFVRYCFGDPVTVRAAGARGRSGGIDHVVASYTFERGPDMVVAEGGWMTASDYPFSMRYRVDFETATAEFDSGQDKPLIVHRSGEGPEAIELPPGDGYTAEVSHFLDCIETGRPSDVVTIEDGLEAVRLVEAETRSIETGEPVVLVT